MFETRLFFFFLCLLQFHILNFFCFDSLLCLSCDNFSFCSLTDWLLSRPEFLFHSKVLIVCLFNWVLYWCRSWLFPEMNRSFSGHTAVVFCYSLGFFLYWIAYSKEKPSCVCVFHELLFILNIISLFENVFLIYAHPHIKYISLIWIFLYVHIRKWIRECFLLPNKSRERMRNHLCILQRFHHNVFRRYVYFFLSLSPAFVCFSFHFHYAVYIWDVLSCSHLVAMRNGIYDGTHRRK